MEKPTTNFERGIYGDAFVYFKDGRQIKIKKVVQEKIEGEILTLNEQTGSFEYKAIIGWHHIGTVKTNADLLNLQAEGLGAYDGGKNGISITLTAAHKVLTKQGWVPAGMLSSTDSLISSYKSIQGQMRDALYAITAGDAHLLFDPNNSKNTAALNLQDSENPDYLQWKINKLSRAIKFHTSSRSFVSEYTHDFKVLRNEISSFEKVKEGLSRNPIYFLDRHFTPLGLAIYIMDDGHFRDDRYYSLSIARFAVYRPVLRIVSEVFKTYGYENKLYIDTKNYQADLHFNKEASRKIAEDIHSYIPTCMQYKLPEDLKNKYDEFDIEFHFELLPDYIKFLSKSSASNRQLHKLKGIYDLEIEGNNNYMAGNHTNGVIVKANI